MWMWGNVDEQNDDENGEEADVEDDEPANVVCKAQYISMWLVPHCAVLDGENVALVFVVLTGRARRRYFLDRLHFDNV